MKSIKSILILFFLFLTSIGWSQFVTGKIIDADSGEAVKEAKVTLIGSEETVRSDNNGIFKISPPGVGRFSYSVTVDGFELFLSNFTFQDDIDLDLGTIRIFPMVNTNADEIAFINESEISESDEGSEVVSLLTASRDEFSRTAAFDFGVARFKIRGYQNNHSEIFLNGMPMNDLDDGYVAWSIWGGLNEVTRRQQSNHSLEPSFFAFGGLGGSNHVSTLASDQRKQIRASYSLTNRSYRQRAMLTYSTGMLQSGWAFSFSGSRRWSQEGYVEATFYDAYAYFASIDKKLNEKHLLNLTLLNAPNQRGKQSGAVQEIYDILDDN